MEKNYYGLEVLAISKLTGNNKMPLKQGKKPAVALLSVKTNADQNLAEHDALQMNHSSTNNLPTYCIVYIIHSAILGQRNKTTRIKSE